ncbi:MAG: hypothetical protein AAFW60_08210 [Pseudomonadota bacterium]
MKNSQTNLTAQSAFDPFYVSESAAAQLFELSVEDFVTLVRQGDLPCPVNIAGHKRWDVSELHKITVDRDASGLGDVKWR